MDQLNSLGTAEPLGMGQLEANMRDSCLSPMIVMLLRMLTSAAIQRRSDFFAPFIMARSRCCMHEQDVTHIEACRFFPIVGSARTVLSFPSSARTHACKQACSMMLNREIAWE